MQLDLEVQCLLQDLVTLEQIQDLQIQYIDQVEILEHTIEVLALLIIDRQVLHTIEVISLLVHRHLTVHRQDHLCRADLIHQAIVLQAEARVAA